MPNYKFQDVTLSADERTAALLEELSLDEKLLLITTRQQAIPRLGIKEFTIGTEVARGLVCRGRFGEAPSTVFPEPFGLAATFDPQGMSEMGEVVGIETRIYHRQGKASLCVWGPTVDPERDPRWGRNEEAYGEDPCLIGAMSAAYTRGMYGSNERYARVIPTLKHFYANNNEENRMSDNSSIPIILKHDYYLKAFEPAVAKGGARSLMTAYNAINGVEGLCNPELDIICRRQWGLLFSVTDGGDFIQNVQFHKTDRTHTDAIARVYRNHGADIMTDDDNIVRAAAQEALDKGLISESDIDKAIYGVVKARILLGEFDGECPYEGYADDLIACGEHYSVAQRLAEESVILLRNSRGVLPLSKSERLAVIGVHADMNFRDWYTGFSDKNPTILDCLTAELGRENIIYESGNDVVALRSAVNGYYFSVGDNGTFSCDSVTIGEGCLLEMYEWGDDAVSFKSKVSGKFLSDGGIVGCTADEPYGWYVREKFTLEKRGSEFLIRNWQGRYLCVNDKGQIGVSDSLKPDKDCLFHIEMFSAGEDRVRRAVTEAHNAVVFCGNNPQIGARECTDRRHIRLPEKQQRLFNTVKALKEQCVMFLVSGYTYALDDSADTVLHISHAGPAMGAAVSKALFGDISPAGRCPVTWYKSDSELCSIKDYNIIRTKSTYLYYDGEPLFPFGHGLSYTAFRYGSLKTDKALYERDETVRVSLDVENVGMRDSDEVVQLYVTAPNMQRPLPKKQLRAFSRVHIPAGECVPVTLEFEVNDLALWDINTQSGEVYGGIYEIRVGASSGDIRRTCEIRVNASEYEGIDVTKPVPAAASTDYLGVEFTSDTSLNEYALISDWQSSISYCGCRMQTKRRLEVVVSNPASEAELTVVCTQTGAVVSRGNIPPTGGYNNFTTLTFDAEPICGLFTLKFSCSGMIAFKSFRFKD